MPIKREDDFEERRSHLKDLSDEELKERFWELSEKIVDPLIDLAKTHTSASIERSVLLRMGFNSVDAKAIVNQVVKADLLSKGAGHVVYKLAQKEDRPVKEVGLDIKDEKYEKEELQVLFDGGAE
ncbi:MAG TPA: ornithine aminomutase subunit alpha [Halanaerobiales bacterium]|nr:ornithine aminomutase subunit alpha [Halanaerobiales bacterium]